MIDNYTQMEIDTCSIASLDEMRDQKLAYFRELMKCRKKLKPFREQESLNPGAMALLEQIQKEINRMVEFLDEYEWMTSDEKNLLYTENMESYIPDVPPEKKSAVERIHREEYPELGLKRMISHANYIGRTKNTEILTPITEAGFKYKKENEIHKVYYQHEYIMDAIMSEEGEFK